MQVSKKRKLQKLLEPFQIKGVKLKNRMVRPPCALGLSEMDGQVSVEDENYFEAVAKGGVGLVIVGASYVDVPLGITDLRRFWVSDDKFIPGLSKLTQVIHRHGCPTFLELQHSGPSFPSNYFEGLQPVAASSLSENELPPRLLTPYSPPRGLTVPEIEDLVNKFADAANRAIKAGFDGVVIEACHSYLINSFLSRAWNKRQDSYGCESLESRAKFAVEIIEAIRRKIGQDYPVGIRINGGEWGIENGITSEESQGFGKILEKAGADFLDISGIGYEPDFGFWLFPEQLLYPEPADVAKSLAKKIRKPGLEVSRAAAVKSVVAIPVITVGRLTPEVGAWILKKGKADLIALGRRLIADPELPNKIASGKLEDIVPCMGALECLSKTSPSESTRCRVNPTLGKKEQLVLKAAQNKKKVLVVGGGPAGMEAARVSALRGHEVTLCEKEKKLGGLLPVAGIVKGFEIENLALLVRYFKTQIKKVGVKVMLGKEADLALVEEIKPDVVIIATGGMFSVPDVPGINLDNVVTSSDLHRRVKAYLRFVEPRILRWLTNFYLPFGEKIVVMGGLIQGCEIAEFLVKRGRKVTIVETSDQLGSGIPIIRRPRLFNWFSKKGVNMLPNVKYEEITDKGLTITKKGGERQTIEADNILVAMPGRANTHLFEKVKGKVSEAYMIGDCKEPRLMMDAIAEGSSVGHLI